MKAAFQRAVRWRGEVATLDDLPAAEPGDVFYVTAAAAIAVLLDDGWRVFPLGV